MLLKIKLVTEHITCEVSGRDTYLQYSWSPCIKRILETLTWNGKIGKYNEVTTTEIFNLYYTAWILKKKCLLGCNTIVDVVKVWHYFFFFFWRIIIIKTGIYTKCYKKVTSVQHTRVLHVQWLSDVPKRVKRASGVTIYSRGESRRRGQSSKKDGVQGAPQQENIKHITLDTTLRFWPLVVG